MDSPRPSLSRYLLVTLAFLLLGTTFILIAINAYFLQQPPRQGMPKALPFGSTTEAYRQGYEAARADLQRFCPLMSQKNLHFTGTITAINDSRLTVTQESLPVNPEVDGISDHRQIQILATTTFVKTAMKPPEQFAKEIQDFSNKNTDGTTMPPAPFSETPTTLSALRIGSKVQIFSASDLTKLETIEATQIRLME